MLRDYSNAPDGIKALPLDERGYPVPWFVEIIDGKPDFRVMDADKWRRAVQFNLCWLTGERMGGHKTFVVGPMCGINRTSAEPPCKKEAALFAAQACPFLALPKKLRNERDMPDNAVEAAGTMLKRNPGVAMLWTTKKYNVFRPNGGGYLINMGDPVDVMWFCEGRAATRDEVMHSIETGLPALQEVAEKHNELGALQKAIDRFMPLVPKN